MLHESPKLVLVRFRGNEAAHSLYVLKCLRPPRSIDIAVAEPARLQIAVKQTIRLRNQRMGACWPIAPQYHDISINDLFWHSGPKKPSRGIEDARCAVSVAMLSSRCVCAHVRRNPLIDSTKTQPDGAVPRGRPASFGSVRMWIETVGGSSFIMKLRIR